MANIVKYEKTTNVIARVKPPVNVECIYQTQKLPDGSKMLVIKTHNPDSKNDKNCRTIHFTKESAIKLIDIFKQEFGI